MVGAASGDLELPAFDPAPRVLIVVSPYYFNVANALLAGARSAIEAVGGRWEIVEVPGALEIPTAIALAHRQASFDGFVALGCVIRGETTHYDTVCSDSSRALQLLGLEGACIGNGILTVETMEQAKVRADPAGQNKGGGAACAALHLIAVHRKWAKSEGRIGFRAGNAEGDAP